MKNMYLLLSLGLITLIISATAFLRANAPGNSTSFSYKETSTAIIMKVSYDPAQAPQVEKYVDSCLQPEVVFGNSHKASKEVKINVESNYQFKASPGSLKMTADKYNNSTSSLDKIKNIFHGLKSVIKAD